MKIIHSEKQNFEKRYMYIQCDKQERKFQCLVDSYTPYCIVPFMGISQMCNHDF